MSEALIKAIPTKFDGHTFRSKLEAQWAVFFKEAHIKYDYEPEGFEQENGTRYLPDFYLPDQKIWAEVKPDRPNAFEELKRAISFVKEDGLHRLLILPGIPHEDDRGGIWWFPYVVYDTVSDMAKLIRGFFLLWEDSPRLCADWHPATAETYWLNDWALEKDAQELAHKLVSPIHDYDMPYQKTTPYNDEDWIKRRYGYERISYYYEDEAELAAKCFDTARNYKFDHRGGGSK